ncbi:hypothetical protein ACHAW5_009043 [Stephanodiscus triporus]|uniref:Uncharacterized protein n=1 Tax=Stephanodiscus triporus TaxID=2934178 RepID=A0ABD3MLA8_9STRA
MGRSKLGSVGTDFEARYWYVCMRRCHTRNACAISMWMAARLPGSGGDAGCDGGGAGRIVNRRSSFRPTRQDERGWRGGWGLRAHHDSVTEVRRQDGPLRPWVGNAAGIMNHKASGRASRNWAFRAIRRHYYHRCSDRIRIRVGICAGSPRTKTSSSTIHIPRLLPLRNVI